MHKVVLITGASSGIGYYTAKLFLERKYTVINLSRRASSLSSIVNYSLNISDGEAIDKTIKEIIDKYHRIDVLINSAACSISAPIDKVHSDDYDYLIKVNLIGAIRVINNVVPIMKIHNGGRIINISSIASLVPIPYDPYYCASKAGLDMLSHTLNTELNRYNIKVVTILPGGTATDFTYKRKLYGDKLSTDAAMKLAQAEQYGNSPETVARAVFKVATARKPPVILITGAMNKIIYCMTRLISKRALIYLTRKYFNSQ